MSDVNLAEALYRARCLLAQRPRGLIRDHAVAVEHELVAALLDAGHDPGTTALDADALKLRLMTAGAGATQAAGLKQALDEAAELSGSQSVWRELERFTHFCARMRLSKPGQALISDDKQLPVYAWCRSDGRAPAADLGEAAKLYLGWTREALEQFWQAKKGRTDG